MKNQNLKTGIFIAILGIASIIISQTANFPYQDKVFYPMISAVGGGMHGTVTKYHTEYNTGLLYGGVIVLILGSGISTFGSSTKDEHKSFPKGLVFIIGATTLVIAISIITILYPRFMGL